MRRGFLPKNMTPAQAKAFNEQIKAEVNAHALYLELDRIREGRGSERGTTDYKNADGEYIPF